jgi:hypothetical protein
MAKHQCPWDHRHTDTNGQEKYSVMTLQSPKIFEIPETVLTQSRKER